MGGDGRTLCTLPGPSAAPWLMIPYRGKGNKRHQAFYNICEADNNPCKSLIPELSGTSLYQKPSHRGWLLVLCDDKDYDYTTAGWNYGDCFLWNPVTAEKIQLPTLLGWLNDSANYELLDCVLSSPPRITNSVTKRKKNKTTKTKTDSVVLFVFCPEEMQDEHDYEHVFFVYCRPGEKLWRKHKLSRGTADLWEIQSALCFKGRLYVMGSEFDHQEIIVYDDFPISVKPFHVKKDVVVPTLGGTTTYRTTDYVECSDELFMVDILYHDRVDSDKEVVAIEVRRLNMFLMMWETVHNFGEHVIFLGGNTTACCLAADLGLTSGCLYYVVPADRSLYKFRVENTGNTVILPCPDLPTPWFTSEWIMMPDIKHVKKKNILREERELELGILISDKNQGEAEVARYTTKENKNKKIKQTKVANYWDVLNEDIIELIAAKYVHGLEYKHFRSVCKANRAIMPKVKPTSYSSPWLVFSEDHSDTIYSVVNPMYHNENYLINFFDLAGSTIRFQKGGWLLMTRSEKIFFYDPFTRETVKLPDMDSGYCYSVVSCSSLPTSLDCIVFAMDNTDDKVSIDFIRRGEEHWTSCIFDNIDIERYMPLLNTAVFHDGAFFCVDYNGSFGVFNVKDSSWEVLEEPNGKFDTNYPAFLVDCGGDLLLVKLGYLGGSVRVFKLNFSEIEWVEVKSLGEHMLFITYTSCLSAVAPNNNMKNNIYFPRLHVNDRGVIFYSLETRSYHSTGSKHSEKDLIDTEGWFENCTWIEPNINRLKSTTQDLSWH